MHANALLSSQYAKRRQAELEDYQGLDFATDDASKSKIIEVGYIWFYVTLSSYTSGVSFCNNV